MPGKRWREFGPNFSSIEPYAPKDGWTVMQGGPDLRRVEMKKFHCGDLVPECDATFEAADEAGILEAVRRHAADSHAMDSVPDEVADAVRRSIVGD